MATITIPDDLQRAAEEYSRQTGESLGELIERLLTNVAIRAPHLTASLVDTPASEDVASRKHFAIQQWQARQAQEARALQQATAEAEALEEQLRIKYDLKPLSPAIANLQGSIQLPPGTDYREYLGYILWERYLQL